MADKKIGEFTHYYSNIGVGTIMLSGTLKVGDSIRILGATSDFEQSVDEMQFDHKSIKKAKAGQEVGLKVEDKVRDKDEVYLV